MAAKSRIIGRERVQEKLRALPDAVQAPIKAQIAAAGEAMLATATRRVPVDHGDLKSSIAMTVEKQGLAVSVSALAIARRGAARFNYAWFVEFGTRRAVQVTISARGKARRIRRRTKVLLGKNARPFMFPAYRMARRMFRLAVGREVRRALGIIARRF